MGWDDGSSGYACSFSAEGSPPAESPAAPLEAATKWNVINVIPELGGIDSLEPLGFHCGRVQQLAALRLRCATAVCRPVASVWHPTAAKRSLGVTQPPRCDTAASALHIHLSGVRLRRDSRGVTHRSLFSPTPYTLTAF